MLRKCYASSSWSIILHSIMPFSILWFFPISYLYLFSSQLIFTSVVPAIFALVAYPLHLVADSLLLPILFVSFNLLSPLRLTSCVVLLSISCNRLTSSSDFSLVDFQSIRSNEHSHFRTSGYPKDRQRDSSRCLKVW